jgi:hypothetical protein
MMETKELQIAEKTSSNFRYYKKLTKYEGASNWVALKKSKHVYVSVIYTIPP